MNFENEAKHREAEVADIRARKDELERVMEDVEEDRNKLVEYIFMIRKHEAEIKRMKEWLESKTECSVTYERGEREFSIRLPIGGFVSVPISFLKGTHLVSERLLILGQLVPPLSWE